MGCCGQKRNSLPMMMPGGGRMAGAVPEDQTRTGIVTAAGTGAGRTGSGPSAGTRQVALRYRERARVRVLGPVTKQAYEFSPDQAAQPVDARDAEALLRTRQFLRA